MESEYRVVIQVPGAPGRRRPAERRITYQVTRLRPGVHQWFLISDEEQPKTSGSSPARRLQPAAHK